MHLALTLLLLVACRPPEAWRPALIPPESVVMGWRLVPGTSLTYALTSRYDTDSTERVRTEQWSYLVRDVDAEGKAELEATLVGFGAELREAGVSPDAGTLETAIDRERERLSDTTTTFTLSMDGRLEILEGSWADRVPHRLLGLILPERELRPGENWSDPTVSRAYADLLPVGMELELSGTHRLDGLYDRDGRIQARIRTQGAVRPVDSTNPGTLWLKGDTWWDLQGGYLEERTLEVSLLGARADEPGPLKLEARRIR